MERLSDNAIAIINDLHTECLYYQSEYIPLIDAANRLAAYEDSGLEPGEIRSLCSMDSRAKMADLLRLEEYQELGSIEYLRELVQPERAERDGRLAGLPCKVGSIVYALWSVPNPDKYVIYCAEVKEIRISKRNCRVTTTYWLEPIEFRGRRKEYRDDDFGKTVFLTREEAEAAMEGVEET